MKGSITPLNRLEILEAMYPSKIQRPRKGFVLRERVEHGAVVALDIVGVKQDVVAIDVEYGVYSDVGSIFSLFVYLKYIVELTYTNWWMTRTLCPPPHADSHGSV